MSGDILKELLVSIGYEVVPGSEAKVTKSLDTVEKKTEDFVDTFVKGEKGRVKATTEANKAITVSTEKFVDTVTKVEKERVKATTEANTAVGRSMKTLVTTVFGAMTFQRVADQFSNVTRQMEDLFYTAQRSNTTVTNIRGLSDAFSRMGLQAQDAVGAVEALARTIRTQPGSQGLLAAYGINPKGDETDNLLNLTESLKKRFGGSKYGYATAARIAGEQFGISENVFFQLWNNPAKAREELEKSRKVRGPNQDANAEEFTKLANKWRDFMQAVEGPLENFEATLAGPLSKVLDDINKNGLAPFVAGLGTLLSTLVGGAAVLAVGRMFGLGGAGAAAGAGSAGAAVGASGGLFGGLLGGVLGAVGLGGLAGQYLDSKTGLPGASRIKSADQVRKSLEDQRPWYKRAWDAITGASADGDTGGFTHADVVAHLRQAAIERGIDPDAAVAVASTEGLNGYDPSKMTVDKGGDAGTSFGQWQFHYKSNIPGFTSAGLGDDFTRDTGLHASDPKNFREMNNYALDYAAKHGWGAWHGWKGDPWAGISKNARALGQTSTKEASSGGGTWDWITKHLPSMPSFGAQAATFDKQTSSTPLAPSPSSTANDNSKSVSIGDTNINVHGSVDADMAAALGRRQHRLNQDLLSSVEGAIR